MAVPSYKVTKAIVLLVPPSPSNIPTHRYTSKTNNQPLPICSFKRGEGVVLWIINGTLFFLRKNNFSLLFLRKINWGSYETIIRFYFIYDIGPLKEFIFF